MVMFMKKPLLLGLMLAALTGQAVAGPAAQAQGTPAVRVVRLGRRGRRLLADVNGQVNREFKALAPLPHDVDPDGVWDCENYAGEKRNRLAQAGVPWSAMRTWEVTTGGGEAHMVLVVYGEDGPHVLDNLHMDVKAWPALGYAAVKPNWPPVRASEARPADPVADWVARVSN